MGASTSGTHFIWGLTVLTLLLAISSAEAQSNQAPADEMESNPYADSGDTGKSAANAKSSDQVAPLSENATGEGSLRRSGRMEFDERLIKGQTAKSGAVYLFKRTPRRLPGLVPMCRSYRARIVEPILGRRAIRPAHTHTQTEPSTAEAGASPEQPKTILPALSETPVKKDSTDKKSKKKKTIIMPTPHLAVVQAPSSEIYCISLFPSPITKRVIVL